MRRRLVTISAFGVACDNASPAADPFTPGPEWYRELDDQDLAEVPGALAPA